MLLKTIMAETGFLRGGVVKEGNHCWCSLLDSFCNYTSIATTIIILNNKLDPLMMDESMKRKPNDGERMKKNQTKIMMNESTKRKPNKKLGLSIMRLQSKPTN